MIPHDDPKSQPPFASNGAAPPAVPPDDTPTCAPGAQLSAALDWVDILQDDLATLHAHLHHLKAALEEVMP